MVLHQMDKEATSQTDKEATDQTKAADKIVRGKVVEIEVETTAMQETNLAKNNRL